MREYLLNNGVGIPVLGFGTWKAQDGEEAYQATLAALKAGYRHIDTAAIYKNEERSDGQSRTAALRGGALHHDQALSDIHTYEEAQEAFAGLNGAVGTDLDLTSSIGLIPNPEWKTMLGKRNAGLAGYGRSL